jgi:hypothetical protein
VVSGSGHFRLAERRRRGRTGQEGGKCNRGEGHLYRRHCPIADARRLSSARDPLLASFGRIVFPLRMSLRVVMPDGRPLPHGILWLVRPSAQNP